MSSISHPWWVNPCPTLKKLRLRRKRKRRGTGRTPLRRKKRRKEIPPLIFNPRFAPVHNNIYFVKYNISEAPIPKEVVGRAILSLGSAIENETE